MGIADHGVSLLMYVRACVFSGGATTACPLCEALSELAASRGRTRLCDPHPIVQAVLSRLHCLNRPLIGRSS